MEKTQQILIKFKKKVVKFKRKMDEINQKIYFYKDILMSMINNLSHCNSLKIFQEIAIIKHWFILLSIIICILY
jgi:hypothetical protein